MPELGKGGNTAVEAGRLVVELRAVGDVVDLSALLVDADGKVRSDDDMVFYNQPAAESGAVQHRPADADGPERIEVEPAALPADVDRVVLVGSCDPDDASRTFREVKEVTVRVGQGAAEPVLFRQPDLTDGERAVLLVEFYRRGPQWKLRAIGQGYAAGLAGLATDFGIDVAEPEPIEATQPAGATQPTAATQPAGAPQPPAVTNAPTAPAAPHTPEPPIAFALPTTPAAAAPRANLRKPPLGALSLEKGGQAAIDLDKHDRELVVEAALEWDGGSESRRQRGADLDFYALFIPATEALSGGPKAPGTLVKSGHTAAGEPLLPPSPADEATGATKAETKGKGKGRGRSKRKPQHVVYYKRLGSLTSTPYICLDGDARAPGRESIRIVRPDVQGYVLLCAYSALSNGVGSFRSFGAKVVISDGRGSTVTVPLYEDAQTRYWVAIALIDFTSPDGVAIQHVEAYSARSTERRPLLHRDGTIEMNGGPVEFKRH
ncbi:TerD family protein [Streptomyces sp. HSW2009]|uniref:TerD family protein n=1 Tax=Streptomyces sp. HSW2009 TaxID=3142890 RepID=UPI0032ED8EFA